MADKVTAKNQDSKFKPHPERQSLLAQCVDTIDLGETVVEFPDKPKYLAQKCAIVFRTGEVNAETGDLIDIASEFTVSMGEKANLRKFLESWRGKPYTQEQVDEGVPVEKLVGQWALISVAHKKSQKGRTYAIIASVAGVPRQMQERLQFDAYTRADWWSEKKKEYAKEASTLRREINAPSGTTEDDIGESGEDFSQDANDDSDSSLPF